MDWKQTKHECGPSRLLAKALNIDLIKLKLNKNTYLKAKHFFIRSDLCF